ncbi:MAG: hypothetical protein IJ461_06130 [Clostridia bacterium]|nr:hypothetical protein [Clostridia bacterium]
MQSLAPDLAEEMSRRALVLERIAALQPVGRRQLAARLNLPEREVRAVANVLKEAGFITLDAAGMTLTPKADDILAASREFSRAMGGLTDMETRLSRLLGVPKVFVAAGDADAEAHVLTDVGRMAAQRVRSLLQSGNTLAVTGGNTMAQVARFMPVASPLNVMVVPARGGIGRAVETQANTLAAEIARRLGGHHRLMHLPDHMDQGALAELLKVPEVKEAMELLQRADVILHGIGRADEMAKHRRLSVSLVRMLTEQGAVAEAFGNYFDSEGRCLYSASSVGVDTAILQPHCQMIAVAAGKRKAQAIMAVIKHYHHAMLVTDEGAARQMLYLLGDRQN